MKYFLFILFILFSLFPKAEPIKSVSKDTAALKKLDDAAWNYLRINPDSAIILADQLFSKAVELNDKMYQAYALNTKGVACDIKGEFEKAIYYYEESKKVYENLKDNKGIASSLLNIGIIYYNQGMYLKAMDYYKRSRKLYENENDQRGIADVYNNISIIYKTQNQLEEAQEYLYKCLEIYKKINDEHGQSIIYANLGINYRLHGNYRDAYTNIVNSFELAEKLNDQISMAGNYIQFGFLFQESKEYDRALFNYEKALKIYQEIGNPEGEADALNSIGSCFNKQNMAERAISYCSEGYQISKRINAALEFQNNCYCLYEAYSKQNNEKNALLYYKEYVGIKDSLLNDKTSKEIAQLTFQYKYRKKEIEDSTKNAEKEKVLRAESEAKQLEIDKQEQRNVFLMAGVGFLLFFGWFMFNRFKVTKKQKAVIEKQKIIVEEQKLMVDEKNKNITDSINYALRIQRSFLPKDDELQKLLKNYFIIYRPKDIVSGDFYWATEADGNNDLMVFALADCTGHGVPGAMMTMIGNTLLNQTIGYPKIDSPAKALNYLNTELPKNLKKELTSASIRDGMDIVMIEIDRKKSMMYFSGANNGIIIVRKGEVLEWKGDKQSVTASDDTFKREFSHHVIELEKEDTIYFWTDGWPDQFGGADGKKFKSSALKMHLIAVSKLPIDKQKHELDGILNKWLNPMENKEFEQVDDITLVGIKI